MKNTVIIGKAILYYFINFSVFFNYNFKLSFPQTPSLLLSKTAEKARNTCNSVKLAEVTSSTIFEYTIQNIC